MPVHTNLPTGMLCLGNCPYAYMGPIHVALHVYAGGRGPAGGDDGEAWRMGIEQAGAGGAGEEGAAGRAWV